MNARLTALAAAALLASCGYDVPSEVENGVVVVTQHAPDANFDRYVTFAIDPTVVVVNETGAVSETYTVDGTNIVPTLSANKRERNFTEVAWRGPDTPADLHLKMSATLGDVETYSYYPGYCGWYPYYYCSPGYTYTGSYNFGTLVITMGDAQNAGGQGGSIPIVWTSASTGILSSYYTAGVPSGGNNVNWARIQEAVNRAFDDSPYIQRTP
jgi:hypothetical protein